MPLEQLAGTRGAGQLRCAGRKNKKGIKICFGCDRNVSNRVLRGGNWNNNANNARCANRNNNNPNNANNNIGFRCVRGIREGAGGNTCPLRAGGVRESKDFRSVPSESPPDAACFPWVHPGERIRRSHRGW